MKRKQYTISFNDEENKRVVAIANQSGETFSGYIRRVVMLQVAKEEKNNG